MKNLTSFLLSYLFFSPFIYASESREIRCVGTVKKVVLKVDSENSRSYAIYEEEGSGPTVTSLNTGHSGIRKGELTFLNGYKLIFRVRETPGTSGSMEISGHFRREDDHGYINILAGAPSKDINTPFNPQNPSAWFPSTEVLTMTSNTGLSPLELVENGKLPVGIVTDARLACY